MLVIGIGGDPEGSLPHRMDSQPLHEAVDTPAGALIFPAQDMVDAVQSQCWIFLMQPQNQTAQPLILRLPFPWFPDFPCIVAAAGDPKGSA